MSSLNNIIIKSSFDLFLFKLFYGEIVEDDKLIFSFFIVIVKNGENVIIIYNKEFFVISNPNK